MGLFTKRQLLPIVLNTGHHMEQKQPAFRDTIALLESILPVLLPEADGEMRAEPIYGLFRGAVFPEYISPRNP